MKKLYLIDFDGTISTKDSFKVFTLYSISRVKFLKYWIKIIFFFILRMNNNSGLKESFYSNFKSMNYIHFQNLCIGFANNKISKIVRKSFLNFLKEFNANSKIVIVSASINNYLQPWCDKMRFDLISTELEIVNGKLTGKFSTPNCNGEEKVRRIKEKYDLSKYDEIHVFGNSKGDLPMLELGTHKYYKFFK